MWEALVRISGENWKRKHCSKQTASPPVKEASVAKWRSEKSQELALMRETPLNKGKKLDHQEISARMSSEIGQDERDLENERKLFNKRATKMRPDLT